MFAYYLGLAVRSLRRNLVLTALMIAAIAVGIGASMTTLTLFRAMSGDPIPWKSDTLFVPQLDNFGPDDRINGEPPDQLSYRDAVALMRAHAAPRQTALYQVAFVAIPSEQGLAPFDTMGRAVYADFFQMFDVPFRSGGGWTAAEDDARANVVVLGAKFNDRLFHGADSVGRTVNLDGRDYRVVGVMQEWDPKPRIYDVISSDNFAETEDVFLPFSTAIDRQIVGRGSHNCVKAPAPGWQGNLDSECVWTQFWVELPTAADVKHYREFLDHYAAEQQRLGRFNWSPLTRLRKVREWLVYLKIVPDSVRVTVIVASGFLVVCLINAVGLMLAKFSSRAGELGVRRALGASRHDIFLQCLVESAVIGVAGGVLGLALTALGLAGERAILPKEIVRLASLDPAMGAITVGAAVLATVCAGLYPTWRASRVQPAWQLKAQ